MQEYSYHFIYGVNALVNLNTSRFPSVRDAIAPLRRNVINYERLEANLTICKIRSRVPFY